jgi:hypothetical protein
MDAPFPIKKRRRLWDYEIKRIELLASGAMRAEVLKRKDVLKQIVLFTASYRISVLWKGCDEQRIARRVQRMTILKV